MGIRGPKYVVTPGDWQQVQIDLNDLWDSLTAAINVTTGGIVTDHNLLSDLQGGVAGEYYHLTAAQHAALSGYISAETDPVFTAWLGTVTPANWNTAYSERAQWDGGSTNLVAATGRTSLGLGTAATHAATDFQASGSYQPLATNLTSLAGLSFTSTSFVKMTSAGTFGLDTATYLTAEADTLDSVLTRGSTSASNNLTLSAGTLGAAKAYIGYSAPANTVFGVHSGSGITPGFQGYCEIISDASHLLPNVPAALSIESYFDSAVNQGYGFGAYISNKPTGTLSQSAAIWVGLYGGCNPTFATGNLGTFIFGLYFSASLQADVTNNAKTPSAEMITACYAEGNLGADTKTISNKGFEYVKGVHGKVNLQGAYTSSGNSSIYGLFAETALAVGYTAPSGSGTITAYGVYINAMASSTGVISWGMYEANGRNNALAGNTRIGGVTAPTYACDVTGDVNCSGVFRSGGTAGITATVTYVDTLLGAKTLTFTKGILTAQT